MVDEFEWIQCEECRKWRILPPGMNPDDLPDKWFCHSEPFNGNCEMPEESEMRANSVTVDCDKSVVLLPANNAPNHNVGVGSSSSKVLAKKTKLLQKSIKSFFQKIEFDEAMQALMLSSLNHNDATQGITPATTIVNIVTTGLCRPRGRPRKS